MSIQDPYSNFIMAIKSPYTRDQYVIRLKRFFRFLGLAGEVEKQSSIFATITDPARDIMNYVLFLRGRVDKKELVWATLRNHIKPIKLFCEMNDISIPWSKLVRGIPSGRRYSHDRAPTLEEIRQIIEYPDRRIKSIVYMMTSGGIRVGAWDYLKWGHITPIERDKVVVAAKMRVYADEEDEYFTFITPEAYKALSDWMEFRKKAGEHVTKDSWLMRNLWDCRGATVGRGKVNEPSKLAIQGLRALIFNAIRYQGVRTETGKRRYEFRGLHGFRKYFKTHAEQVMRPINVELLMGHSTGISDFYYRPPEKELLEDYLKAVPDLTIFKPAATEEQLQARMDSKDQEVQQLKGQMAQMQQDFESYDRKVKDAIEKFKDYDKQQNDQIRFFRNQFEAYREIFGPRPLTKSEREKVELFKEQVEEQIRNNPDDGDYEEYIPDDA